jgi:hypothetical protein
LQQPNSTQPISKVERATAGYVISLVAGILVLAQGIVRLLRVAAIEILGVDEIRRRILGGLALEIIGVISIVFAVLIFIGAFLIYQHGKEIAGGTIVLVFSILSILVGGGFLVGFILGIVGGALGLAKK